MTKRSVLTRIGNAFAARLGRPGDVTQQAHDAGCSRQPVDDHADQVHRAVADAQRPGPSRSQLRDENQRLRDENRQLWDGLAQTIDCPEEKQRPFAVTAAASGLRLAQTRARVAILRPARLRPSRATLGRWVHREAHRARRLRAVLDAAGRPLVWCLCLDEMFFRRQPVLRGVEPASLAWVVGQRAADRSGATWAQALAAWPDLQAVAADGGSGIARGLELAVAARKAAAQKAGGQTPSIHVRLDPFPIGRDGARAQRTDWGYAPTVGEAAEKVERAKGRFERTGADGRKFPQGVVAKAWAKAEVAFAEACRKEQAWARARAALAVRRPAGQLNDRAWAEAELGAAAAERTGRHWAKVRRQLQDPRALTFLDRRPESLAAAEPCAERREALVAWWRWRRSSRGRDAAGAGEAAGGGRETLLGLLQARLGPGWKELYQRVSRVLGGRGTCE